MKKRCKKAKKRRKNRKHTGLTQKKENREKRNNHWIYLFIDRCLVGRPIMIPISREVPNYKYFSYKVDYIPRNTKRKQKLSDNGDARIQVATPENNHIRVKFTAKLCFFLVRN